MLKKLLSGVAGFISGIIATPFLLPQIPYVFFNALSTVQKVSEEHELSNPLADFFAATLYTVGYFVFSSAIRGAISGYKNGFIKGVTAPWKAVCGLDDNNDPLYKPISSQRSEPPSPQSTPQANRNESAFAASQRRILEGFERRREETPEDNREEEMGRALAASRATYAREQQQRQPAPSSARTGQFSPRSSTPAPALTKPLSGTPYKIR